MLLEEVITRVQNYSDSVITEYEEMETYYLPKYHKSAVIFYLLAKDREISDQEYLKKGILICDRIYEWANIVDDIVDKDTVRSDRKAHWVVFGMEPSLIFSYYLYTKVISLIADISSDLAKIILYDLQRMIGGELLDVSLKITDVQPKDALSLYLNRILYKTYGLTLIPAHLALFPAGETYKADLPMILLAQLGQILNDLENILIKHPKAFSDIRQGKITYVTALLLYYGYKDSLLSEREILKAVEQLSDVILEDITTIYYNFISNIEGICYKRTTVDCFIEMANMFIKRFKERCLSYGDTIMVQLASKIKI